MVAAIDPNPRHAGRGLALLEEAGIRVEQGLLEEEAGELNFGFNHWIRHGRPLATLKAAMTLDGRDRHLQGGVPLDHRPRLAPPGHGP